MDIPTASCMSHCCGFLRDVSMTVESALESALLYLELPTNILKSDAVKPMMDAANQFLVACYKDVLKHKDEVMNPPLVGIEAILSSDELQVTTEDAVCDIALKWTEIHYQKDEERRDILSTRLGRYIRLPYILPRKLRKILTCDYFNKDFTTKAALDAMFFKVDNQNYRSHVFVERAYTCRPIKVLEFEVPRQHSLVYLDLRREECAALFPSGQICSQVLDLGGHLFYLTAYYIKDRQRFGLFLNLEEKGPSTFAFNYEFSAIIKTLEKYITMWKGNYDLLVGNDTGGNDVTNWRKFLFGIPWTSFVADNSPYFINGVLQIRAEITIKS